MELGFGEPGVSVPPAAVSSEPFRSIRKTGPAFLGLGPPTSELQGVCRRGTKKRRVSSDPPVPTVGPLEKTRRAHSRLLEAESLGRPSPSGLWDETVLFIFVA